MYKFATKILLALSILLIGGLTATYAQMSSDEILKADIPFSFMLGHKSYSAGEYMIKPVDGPTLGNYMLQLESVKGKTNVIFETSGTSANSEPRESELVFDKIGDHYLLSKIWVKGDINGNEINERKNEKHLMAANQKPEKTSVIAELVTNSKR